MTQKSKLQVNVFKAVESFNMLNHWLLRSEQKVQDCLHIVTAAEECDATEADCCTADRLKKKQH